jgi:hypothetical protein
MHLPRGTLAAIFAQNYVEIDENGKDAVELRQMSARN